MTKVKLQWKKPKEVHLEYLDYMNTQRIDQQGKRTVTPSEAGITEYAGRRKKKNARTKMKRYGSEDAKFTQIKMLDADGKEQTTFRTGRKNGAGFKLSCRKESNGCRIRLRDFQK